MHILKEHIVAKNIACLLFFILTHAYSQKQNNYNGFEAIIHNSQITNLPGKWRINHLITNSETKEFTLTPQSSDKFDNYGNNISLNSDQTFISAYSADCGNDCFTTTFGKYKIIDENYICFYLEKIQHHGDCKGNSEPNKDLGIYYFYKNNNGFNLIKSSGNLERDKLNVQYRDMIITQCADFQNYDYYYGANFLYKWKLTNLKDENEIVAYCMNENQIQEYQFLYAKITDDYRASWVALVKFNNELHYVIYDAGNKQVGLFDDSQVKKIDKLVTEISNLKSLKSTKFKENYNPITSSSDKNTITVYKNKNENFKVQRVEYYLNSETFTTTTIYLHNLNPIYIEKQLTTVNKNITKTSTKGIYVLDWEKSQAINKVVSEDSGQINTSIYIEKPKINAIMEEVRNHKL